MTSNKAYERHIVKGCYAVECGLEDDDDPEVREEDGEGGMRMEREG